MAREIFRDWNFKRGINVRYMDASGLPQRFVKDQAQLLNEIQVLIKAYQDMGMRLTNRQLYYRLVAAASIPNADKVYKRVCKFLTDARYGGEIDWDAIEDRGRTPSRHSQWSGIPSLIDSAVESYRLPRWIGQDHYVEMYCEKQALESVLRPVADRFHIHFGSNKGYSSASTMYELAMRVKAQLQAGKKVKLVYLGDHDASGLDMVRDIDDRLTEFLTMGEDPVTVDNFEVVPIALNMDQIKEYAPPHNPAKMTDPRARWYVDRYGQNSWELDALEPQVMIRIATDAILQYIDMDKYNDIRATERQQKDVLVRFGDDHDWSGTDKDED